MFSYITVNAFSVEEVEVIFFFFFKSPLKVLEILKLLYVKSYTFLYMI